MFVPMAYAFITSAGTILSAVFLCPEFLCELGPEDDEEEEDDGDDEDDEDNEDEDDWEDYEWERASASVHELELMGLGPNAQLVEVHWRKAA